LLLVKECDDERQPCICRSYDPGSFSRSRKLISFLFVHYKEEWHIAESFLDTFDLSEEEMAIYSQFIPNFRPVIFYLTKSSIHELKRNDLLYLILSTVKKIDADELEQCIEQLFRDHGIIFTEEKRVAWFQKVILYIEPAS